MRPKTYTSDITEADLSLIKPCLRIQRTSKWPLLSLLNAVFYVCDQGCKWADLPTDFAIPWQTVYWYFAKWRGDGTWAAINEQLVLLRRQQCKAAALPKVLVIDSQSVKNTATATNRIGYDGGKKIKGRKRLLLTDGAGNLLKVKCFAACVHDGAAAIQWWQEALLGAALFEQVHTLYGDSHFGGVFREYLQTHAPIRVIVPKELVNQPAQQQMKVHKNRWVVERTIAWETNSRRLARDYERRTDSTEAFLLISSIARIIRNKIKPT